MTLSSSSGALSAEHRSHVAWRVLLAAALLLAAAVARSAPPGGPLDILVYGATGKIGSLTVEEALRRGHRVTAVSRDPSQITLHDPRLIPAQGDLLDLDSIAGLVAGKDVVIISVRGIIGDSGSPASALQLIAVENVVDVLHGMGDAAPRFIDVGGAGTLEVRPGVLYADTLPKLFIPKHLELEIAGQVLALEFLHKVDDVRWTYVTPPKHFTNGERTGNYRIGGDRLMKDGHGRSRVSRADFSVALIDEAESAAHPMQRFSVAY